MIPKQMFCFKLKYILFVLFVSMSVTTMLFAANPIKKQHKYQKCRLDCLASYDACIEKAKTKKEVITEEVACLTKKNACLEKC